MVSKGMTLSLPKDLKLSMYSNQKNVIPANIKKKKNQSLSTLQKNGLGKKAFLAKKAKSKKKAEPNQFPNGPATKKANIILHYLKTLYPY